jgi:hypothetical protein
MSQHDEHILSPLLHYCVLLKDEEETENIRLFVVFRYDGYKNNGNGTGLVTALSPDWLFTAKRQQKQMLYGPIQGV